MAGKAAGGDAVFGVRPTPARIVLGRLIGEMVRECPALRMKIATTVNEALIEYLLLEGFEFVICDAPVTRIDERLTTRHLASLPFQFFVRPGHPLTAMKGFALAELRSFPIACVIQTEDNLRVMREWLGLAPDDEFPGSIWCDDYGFLLDAVRDSNAVLLAPALTVVSELAAGVVVPVAPQDPGPRCNCDLTLVTLANRNVSPAVALIIERIDGILAHRLAPTCG